MKWNIFRYLDNYFINSKKFLKVKQIFSLVKVFFHCLQIKQKKLLNSLKIFDKTAESFAEKNVCFLSKSSYMDVNFELMLF